MWTSCKHMAACGESHRHGIWGKLGGCHAFKFNSLTIPQPGVCMVKTQNATVTISSCARLIAWAQYVPQLPSLSSLICSLAN